MSIESRSAQFAPFAALTGYSEAIKEETRLTSKRIEIEEEDKINISNKLQKLLENIKLNPLVTITYFVYDKKKDGGEYITVTNNIKKINTIEKYIILKDKIKIPIDEIIDITSDILKTEE